MERAETLRLATVQVSEARHSRSFWHRTGRASLVAIVLMYLGAVLVLPIAALAIDAASLGVDELIRSLTTPAARDALVMSLVLALIAAVVNGVVGTAGAIVLVRHRFAFRNWLDALCDLPLAISPVMVGLGFFLVVGPQGLIGPYLDALGVKVVFAFPGLVIATLFVTLPYVIREVAYVLHESGVSEEEAAATLGASPWQTFFLVTLPKIRHALAYGLLMTVARSLGEFGAVLVLGGSITARTQTATTFIHDALEERDTAAAYAMAAVLGLTSVGLLLGLEWLKTRRTKTERNG